MIWLSSDEHFGHSNIIKHTHRLQFMTDDERVVMESGDPNAISRLKISWETTRRMDQALLDNINAVVGVDDTLYILGDFCWVRGASDKIAAVYAKYRNQIRCRRIFYIWGNHCPKQGSKGRDAIRHLFRGTYDLLNIRIGDKDYVLSHSAFAIWDKRHYGARHLYGHSHARAENWLDSIMPGRFAMDVGVDNSKLILGEYRPFSIDEIETIMSKRKGFGILRGRDE
jgi:calcineurin-like phosphoesterase family protein